MKTMQRHHWTAIGFLFGALILAGIAARDFLRMRTPDLIIPSDGLSRTGLLSEYAPDLAGTNGDTPYYLYDSRNPGPTMLVLGGTHPNEPAGFIATVVMVENLRVAQGRVFVIPQACLSGFSATEPLEGYPERFSVPTSGGERIFRFGSRGANPLDHWPDPLVYLHRPSGQQLSGNETRNLNRSYPGRSDGSIMERVANGIMRLLETERVTLAFDLHEAAPEIPIINAIVVHEKARDLGGMAVLNLEFEGLQYALEISPQNFRGLSHREWGDGHSVLPILMETSNPIQGRLRGPTDVVLILRGVDIRYQTALEVGRMRISYDAEGESLAKRVGRHLAGISAVVSAYNEMYPDSPLMLEGLPAYTELLSQGVGAFLKPPPPVQP